MCHVFHHVFQRFQPRREPVHLRLQLLHSGTVGCLRLLRLTHRRQRGLCCSWMHLLRLAWLLRLLWFRLRIQRRWQRHRLQIRACARAALHLAWRDAEDSAERG